MFIRRHAVEAEAMTKRNDLVFFNSVYLTHFENIL